MRGKVVVKPSGAEGDVHSVSINHVASIGAAPAVTAVLLQAPRPTATRTLYIRGVPGSDGLENLAVLGGVSVLDWGASNHTGLVIEGVKELHGVVLSRAGSLRVNGRRVVNEAVINLCAGRGVFVAGLNRCECFDNSTTLVQVVGCG